ncbi:MAG: hypothetical protein H6937_02415 [Burkholderiales bacterium]|nr:hypothetical protein [Burkholderiales bacterium]
MSLPQGVNFRSTVGYVTDGSNEHPETTGTGSYPTTTAQGQNVGWETGTVDYRNDRSSSVDARIAGTHGFNAGSTATFRIDLPSSGDHLIRSAMGSATSNWLVHAQLYDDTTYLGDLASSQSIGSGQFVDATDVVRTTPADWVSNNASTTKTFSSTKMLVTIPTGANYRQIAHLYVEYVGGGGGGSSLPVFKNHYSQQGIM